MKFDPKKPHGTVIGMDGCAFEQDGKLFTPDGELYVEDKQESLPLGQKAAKPQGKVQ
jgi:hypothetical protein